MVLIIPINVSWPGILFPQSERIIRIIAGNNHKMAPVQKVFL